MDITGFNEQIGKPPIVKLYNYIKGKIKEKQAAKQPKLIEVKTTPKVTVPVTKAGQSNAIQVAVMPKSALPIKSATTPKVVVMPKKFVPKNAPVTVKKVTPAQLKQIKKAAAVQAKYPKMEAIVKSNGQVLPITKLTQTTAPAEVLTATPVQRSFMPVDLPYQTVKSSSPRLKLKNTPFSFSTDIDMIEPPVDAGNQHYYGK